MRWVGSALVIILVIIALFPFILQLGRYVMGYYRDMVEAADVEDTPQSSEDRLESEGDRQDTKESPRD